MTQTILVVDDDRTVRSATADLLRHAGYEVHEAGSGAEALAMLAARQTPVDLLLTDVNMQRMDGGELSEAAQRLQPSLKVVFMSGYTAGAALHDTEREAGVAFLAKPFVQDQLLRTVRGALRSSG